MIGVSNAAAHHGSRDARQVEHLESHAPQTIDEVLIEDLMTTLQEQETDMTLFFRLLANVPIVPIDEKTQDDSALIAPLRRARCCSVTRVRNLIPAMLCRPTRRAASLLFPLQRVLVTDRAQVFHCVTVTREVCRCVGAANRGSQSDWLTSDADFSIQAVVFVTSGSIPP